MSKVKSNTIVYLTYGKVIKITLGMVAFVIAALPLCTAWIFPFIPYLNKFEILRVNICEK